MRRVVLIGCWVLSMCASAAITDNLDVYGVDQKTAQKILKKYGNDIATLELSLHEQFKKTFKNNEAPESDLAFKKVVLANKIAKENDFLFVDFDSINYFSGEPLYTTIEIIDKAHPERMSFLEVPNIDASDKKRTHKPDLIEEMINYDHTQLSLALNNELHNAGNVKCPVYHCLAGFDHPKLAPYLTLFNNGALKQRKLILATIKSDPDPQRRAAAVFLVGHFQNPHDIISILTPYITDKDATVRNNVMRVIGETMMKAKLTNIDVTPLVAALDSPYDTDRNKALFILFEVAGAKDQQKIIIETGSKQLLALLRLKQPNNHDMAYLILKKISGKDFGEHNIVAWEKWLASQNKLT